MRRRSAVCLMMAASVLVFACSSPGDGPSLKPASPSGAARGGSAPPRAAVETVFRTRPQFGVTVPGISQASLGEVARTTACPPAMAPFFVSVTHGLDPTVLGAVPVTPIVTVEPWNPDKGVNQSDFTLDKTIEGRWDDHYRAIAMVVKKYGRPVLIRFAHEMNGYWYPWASVGSNTPALFVAAWQHVVGIFRDAGVTNALWVWSPNVLRGTSGTPLAEYYPGDKWVDLMGLTGYGVQESSAAQTYGPSMAQLAALSTKPVLLTEVGAQRDQYKTSWIASFGSWLQSHPQVVGFVWTAMNIKDGVKGDWRYDDSEADLAAFRASLLAGRVAC